MIRLVVGRLTRSNGLPYASEPVTFAIVRDTVLAGSVVPGRYHTTTDAGGNYSLSLYAPADYLVSVTDGSTWTINVPAGGAITGTGVLGIGSGGTGASTMNFITSGGATLLAVGLSDAAGHQIGIPGAPLEIGGTAMAALLAATQALQSALILQSYGTNDVDVASATVTYVGKEDSAGAWMVLQIDTTAGTVLTYGTVVNNPAVANYAAAWAARATTLVYGTYGAAF